VLQVRIVGESPIIMHSAAGMDNRSELSLARIAIAKKKGTNRTASDDARLREIEVEQALWLRNGKPYIPEAAIRTCIETGAKTQKQGAQVRGGLIVVETSPLEFDTSIYGETLQDWVKSTAFTQRVVVQRAALLRTRAMFEPPWAVSFKVDVDEELVDAEQLDLWLRIAGRRVGIGGWRPEKSGPYGRFSVDSIEQAD